MFPSQAHQRPSKNHAVNKAIKSMRDLLSSNRRNLATHNSVDNASSSDLAEAAPTNPRIQAGGNVTSFALPQTVHVDNTAPDHGQYSTTNRSLSLLRHGFEQLVKKIGPCLEGTPAKIPVNVLNAIINITNAVVDNKSALSERILQTLDRLSTVNNALLQAEQDDAMERAMRNFAGKLVDEAIMLKGMSSSRVWEKIIENEEDAKKIEESFKRLDENTKNFQLEIVLSIERNTRNLSDGVSQLQLENLPLAREALYNTADSNMLAREPCTPGTRVTILERIYCWAQDSSSSPRIFWLTGNAGSGKSTIAYTVARHFDNKTKSESQNILRANFFCSRQFNSTRRREYIIPTIVYQLAHRSRSYARALLSANKFGSANVLSDQMKDLLVSPWQKSASERPSELPPYLIVIDALDEIDDEGGPAFLRELLTTVDEGRLQGLKFLITSRPHPELASLCASFPPDAVCHLYGVPMDTVKADIMTYLKVKLPDLQDEPGLMSLAEKADGLFIYAATVMRYIRPRNRMAKSEQLLLMNNLSGGTWPVSAMGVPLIDKLYQQILHEAFSNLEEELVDTRLSILHTFLCTVERVSPSTAATLISCTPGAEDIASFVACDLHAVLYESEGCIFWYHASFQDFIFSKTRSKFTIAGHNVDMSCDVASHNALLARHCFQIMTSKLRFNICNLPSSFLLDSEVPEHHRLLLENIDNILYYCCQHWAQHLARARNNREDLRTKMEDFLSIRVLFWIEAMNLIGLRLECNSILQQAREWVLEVDGCPSDLTRDITEAANFATYFTSSPAALSTPHLYVSSLATWSRTSSMSQGWKNQFSHVPSFTITKSGDDMALMTMPIGLNIKCVAFSSDATRIVSGSFEGSVQVWDASNGAKLKLLNGHNRDVTCAAFSGDATLIASGWGDKSVRVWDVLTGMEMKRLIGHTGGVNSVAFSSDSTRIVSASFDNSLRVWDASTCTELRILKGHTAPIVAVEFSNDCTHVISGSYDTTVRVWNVLTGAELKILNGHVSTVRSVSFSRDGTLVVSGSDDKSVRVWDVLTGMTLKTMNGHTGGVNSVAFSSDGTRIVSGSLDKSVRVWDVSTGAELKTLNGHTKALLSVAFSDGGTRIISASYDDSLRVWDASTGPELKTLDGHTDFVLSVAFFGDGTRIVSGSTDKSVRVWDASTGVELQKLDGHTSSVWSVACSSDGTRIVSGSLDRSVRVWNARMGTQLKKLEGHVYCVRSVAFSRDGIRIISGSEDKSVRIWDTSTGAELKKMIGHSGYVHSVMFSSDGTRIVSGSHDKSVRIWDALTGAELKKLSGHVAYVCSVAFSSDGTRIVSGSGDRSVRVWDVSTGIALKTLNGHTDTVNSVAFSSDGTRITSGSIDDSVRVWDTFTGTMIKTLNGHGVRSVAFSKDGTRIVSGSINRSVRVWDLGNEDRDWRMNQENWIVSLNDQERLVWVPSDICGVLYYPHNTLVISHNGSAKVDFTHSRIGTEWAKCYTPTVT